jgi:fructose-1,6-bisphosphatase/inositol monophosphatase family enzyme
VRQRLEEACLVSRSWGDGYGYFLVATGHAEVMIDPLMNAWDAAAVETVITEAGGRFSDWQGRGRIDSGEGLATNSLVHEEVLQLLHESG